MAKLSMRADGRYQANICIGVDSTTGKRKFKTVYAKTQVELERKKAEILSALSHGTYADDKGYTVRSWGVKWLNTYKLNIIENNTYAGYENIIKNHLGNLADIRLMQITKTDIQEAINSLSGHYDLQRRLRLTLNQMLEIAIDDGLVYKNVSRNVTLPQKPRSTKRALTDFEKVAISKADFSEKQNVFIQLLLYTGMRRGEILALKKSDIDLRNDVINVCSSLEFGSNDSKIKNTKSVAGERQIDILSPLKPVLVEYLSHLDSLYLFTKQSGELMTKMSYRRFWEGIYTKINLAAGGRHHYEKSKVIYDINVIPDLTPHIFRHNFATILFYAGVDIKDAQRILGHADSKTTIDIYTHLDQQRSGSRSKIENFFALENKTSTCKAT